MTVLHYNKYLFLLFSFLFLSPFHPFLQPPPLFPFPSVSRHLWTKQVSVDKDMVDFGGVFVGEVMRKTVTLMNSGALPTHFSLVQLISPSQVRHWGHGSREREGGIGQEGTTVWDFPIK